MQVLGHWKQGTTSIHKSSNLIVAVDDVQNTIDRLTAISVMTSKLNLRYQNVEVPEWVDFDVPHISSILVDSPEFEQLFEELSIDDQVDMVSAAIHFSIVTLPAYTLLLKLHGHPKIVLDDDQMFHDSDLVYSTLCDTFGSVISAEDFQMLISRFLVNTHIERGTGAASGLYVVLYLAKLLFDTEPIIDLSKKCRLEHSDLNLIDMVRILQDWENLQKYPVEWASQVSRANYVGSNNE